MNHYEQELYNAIRKCSTSHGLASVLGVVLEWAKGEEEQSKATEFHNSYRICSNLIEAAAVQVADI